MPETITQAEFASRLGVSRQAVHDAVKRGRLSGAALSGNRVVLPFAEAQWQGRADPAAQLSAGVTPVRRAEPAAAGSEGEPDVYRDAKAREALAAAELREMQLAEKRNLLRGVDEVAEVCAALAGKIKAALERLPGRAEELAAAGREGDVQAVRAVLRRVVRDAEQDLADSVRALVPDA